MTGRPGEGFRNPCDFAAEAVLFGKLFPRDPLFLTVLFPISELVVVTDPLPVADDTSKDVVSLAMALATIPKPFYTALITSERSKSATRSDPTKSGCLTDPSWLRVRVRERVALLIARGPHRNQNRMIPLYPMQHASFSLSYADTSTHANYIHRTQRRGALKDCTGLKTMHLGRMC